MCQLMFYFLLGGLFTSFAHVDVRMIVVQSDTDEKLYLDNYTAHTAFVSWLKNEAYWKVRNGISYGLCHMKNEPEMSMYRMNAIKYTIMHLFQALSSGDFAYTQVLMNITLKHNKTSPEALFSWFESNFQFPQTDLYNVIKNFVAYCVNLNSSCPRNIIKIMLMLSEKYFMLDKALLEEDFQSAKWIVDFNITNISPRAIELLWLNRKGHAILNEVLHHMVHDEKHGQIIKLLSKVSKNDSFIEFIVQKRHFKLIHVLLENNEINPCITLIQAFETNAQEVTTLVEIHKGLDNICCEDQASVKLLHLSLSVGRVDVARSLIKFGTNVDSTDEKGLTPLYKSLLSNSSANTEVLLDFGANFNSTILTGKTLLLIAVEKNDTNVIEKLLRMGASPLVNDSNGVNPLQLAIDKDDTQIVKILSNKINNIDKIFIGDIPLLHYVVLVGSSKITRNILDTRIDVNHFHGQLYSPLMVASKNNDTIKMLFLAEYGAKIDLRNKDGNTALHIAVVGGSFSAVKVLLLFGADINAINKQGQSPLYLAVKDNEVDIIQYLLDKGADITQKHENGGTLLHLAANYGSVEAFENLIFHNLTLDSTNNNNETPLYVAVKSNKPQVISMIESLGGNIQEKSQFGSTLLHLAVENGNLEAMVELLKLGLDINVKNNNGSSALYNAILKNNFIMLKEMLTHAKNIFLESEFIILAASKGCINSLRALNEIWKHYGLSIYSPNWQNGRTPLSEAVMANQVEVVQYLKENGANISLKLNNGNSLMHLAAMTGSLGVLKNLIDWKMEINSYNNLGETPLWLATKHGNMEAMKLLKDNGADINIVASKEPWEGGNLLLPAAYSGNTKSILWLISKHLLIDHADLLGQTALHVASEQGNENAVVTLLDEGASVDSGDIIGETSLHKAIINEHTTVAKKLIEYGANLDAITLGIITPLHQACTKGNSQIVDALLKNGAEKDIADVSGWTPLHWATYYGYSKIVDKLLDKSLNYSVKNSDGLKPLDLAIERKHHNIIKIFADHQKDIVGPRVLS